MCTRYCIAELLYTVHCEALTIALGVLLKCECFYWCFFSKCDFIHRTLLVFKWSGVNTALDRITYATLNFITLGSTVGGEQPN